MMEMLMKIFSENYILELCIDYRCHILPLKNLVDFMYNLYRSMYSWIIEIKYLSKREIAVLKKVFTIKVVNIYVLRFA